MAYDIFISYRRDGGEYTAKLLRDRLQEEGYRVFFDVESLRAGDFNTKLYSVIDECTDFLLVLSPDALDRCENEGDWVRREVEYALAKGKNVIPVMLRGFVFPAELPQSLEPLRFRNGLEANSQFFDAFLQQLREKFLLTKPPVWRRVTQSSVLRRTLPFLLALALVAAVGLGVKAVADRQSALYPRTNGEKNLTGEVIYYAMNNLTSLDMMGATMDDALQAAERYLSSGGADFTELQNRFAVSRQVLEDIDLETGAMRADLPARLTDSPFAVSDVAAMHDSVVSFWGECAETLDYIESVADPAYYMATEDKLEIVACYRVVLEATLQAHAYGCNEMLLPITAESALEEFWYEYLPGLTTVPLSAAGWQENGAALESEMELCLNRMEEALLDLSVLIGNTNVENEALRQENEALRETLVVAYMDQGYTREEAEALIELYPELVSTLMEIRAACLPQEGDDEDTLWWKMMNLLACRFYDDARDCAAACRDLVWEEDPYAGDCFPVLEKFIDHCQTNGLTYGAMVRGYHEPDGINQVFQIGDIIVTFNGEPCVSYEAYMELKGSLDGGGYTVEVLRLSPAGEWERVFLDLTTDMPRVRISTLVYTESE